MPPWIPKTSSATSVAARRTASRHLHSAVYPHRRRHPVPEARGRGDDRASRRSRIEGLRPFLEGFGADLDFAQYIDDPTHADTRRPAAEDGRADVLRELRPRSARYNENAKRYFGNLSSSGHGSVYEHATFSFLCYGISRSNTHEIVRHRAGTAFSQLSQRFVSGQGAAVRRATRVPAAPALHKRFEERIDRAAREYEDVADELMALQAEGDQLRRAEAKTDSRKRVQQTARSVLPNESETILVLVREHPGVASHDRDAHRSARRVRDP